MFLAVDVIGRILEAYRDADANDFGVIAITIVIGAWFVSKYWN